MRYLYGIQRKYTVDRIRDAWECYSRYCFRSFIYSNNDAGQRKGATLKFYVGRVFTR